MKAETVLKLNGGDIAAAEERCAEWIKAYSAVAEEHPSAEEKAAKLIARAKNALDVIKTRAEAGLYCRFLKRVSPKKENGDFVLYSFIANSASFWVGYYLATVLPGIF